MATLPVLRQAAAAGRNLIVTCEPTFYNGNDDPGPRASDPVYLAKKAFIDERRLVVWRFSDHWGARVAERVRERARRHARLGETPHRREPADLCHSFDHAGRAGRARARHGWASGAACASSGTPACGSGASSSVRARPSLQATIDNLPQADVILSGEPREWEAVEYVFDTASAGQPKGMIAVGRVVSEEPGMRACAAWLRTIVTEVPVEAIAVGDPYWRPPSLKLRRAGHDRRSDHRPHSRRSWPARASRGAREGATRSRPASPRPTCAASPPPGCRPSTCCAGRRRTGRTSSSRTSRRSTTIATSPPTLESDPVYLAKQRFIAEHDLVVWRFHDHAHLDAARPARSRARRARSAGRSMRRRTIRALYILPADDARRARRGRWRERLGDRALRVVGDPAMKVSRVVLGPGYGMPVLTAAVDVVVGGEIGESGGNAEYALDAAAAGQPQGDDHPRPHDVRGSRDAGGRGVAADVPDRRAGRVHPGGRAFLELGDLSLPS